MASQAYVFIYATPGKVEAVAKAVRRLRGVKSVHPCWGRPDVIAFIEAANPEALGQLVLRRIHRLRGVEATDTRIVVEV